MKFTISLLILLCSILVFAEGTMIIPIPISTSNDTRAYYFDEFNELHIRGSRNFENVQDIKKYIIGGRVVFIHDRNTQSKEEIAECIKTEEKSDTMFLIIAFSVIILCAIITIFMGWYLNR